MYIYIYISYTHFFHINHTGSHLVDVKSRVKNVGKYLPVPLPNRVAKLGVYYMELQALKHERQFLQTFLSCRWFQK